MSKVGPLDGSHYLYTLRLYLQASLSGLKTTQQDSRCGSGLGMAGIRVKCGGFPELSVFGTICCTYAICLGTYGIKSREAYFIIINGSG